jgi:hypothetical protein
VWWSENARAPKKHLEKSYRSAARHRLAIDSGFLFSEIQQLK